MQARSTSAMFTFRSIESTVGLSVSGVFFRSCLSSQVARTDESEYSMAMNGTGNHFQTKNFHVTLTDEDSPDAFMYALHRTFQLAGVFAVCGFICAFFIKNNKLASSIDGDKEDTTEYTRVNVSEEVENTWKPMFNSRARLPITLPLLSAHIWSQSLVKSFKVATRNRLEAWEFSKMYSSQSLKEWLWVGIAPRVDWKDLSGYPAISFVLYHRSNGLRSDELVVVHTLHSRPITLNQEP